MRVIIALGRKTVFAAQITVVGDIEAQGFDDRFFLCHDFEIVAHRCKKHFLSDQFIQFCQRFIEFSLGIGRPQCFIDGILVGAVIDVENIVSHLVDDIDDAAVDIEQHIRSILAIFMDHRIDLFRHSSSIQKEYPLPSGKGCPLNVQPYFVQT